MLLQDSGDSAAPITTRRCSVSVAFLCVCLQPTMHSDHRGFTDDGSIVVDVGGGAPRYLLLVWLKFFGGGRFVGLELWPTMDTGQRCFRN
uniref:Uncharacterized protein n=1 Tax=Pristionchus pacificus TaxID=54126 RepID=A0A2A6BWF3_PRIPA|eukprot:PDM70250.1 hypothetical protein PRIPAC_46496 [Pristionchus pacificus]